MAMLLRSPFFERPTAMWPVFSDLDDDDLTLGWNWPLGQLSRHRHRHQQADKIWVNRDRVDMSGFQPDDISVKVEDGHVVILALQEEVDSDNVERKERKRKILVPTDVDSAKLKTSLLCNGVLRIEAPRKECEQKIDRYTDLNVSLPVGFEKDGESSKSVKLDLAKFSAEEISIKVKDGELIVHAKHETESSYRESTRKFIIPKDIDAEKIQSSMSKDGVLTVSAPLLPCIENKERTVPIETATNSETETSKDSKGEE